MRIFIVIFLSIIFSYPTQASILRDLITQRAQAKNVKRFVEFSDSINAHKLLYIDRTIQWGCHKDNSQFIGSYWQLGFRFTEMGMGRKDELTDVYLFISSDSLFYCEVIDPQLPKDAGILFNFNDSLTMKRFSGEWKKTYGVELKLSDFDSLDYTYGFTCGIDGVRTDGRLLVDEMVRTIDLVTLEQWLQSPLPGRQAYAVDGFYQLYKRGVWPTEAQRKKIKAVQERDAALSFCAGCNYSIKRLKDVTKSFVF
jgi:hypothetical protein